MTKPVDEATSPATADANDVRYAAANLRLCSNGECFSCNSLADRLDALAEIRNSERATREAADAEALTGLLLLHLNRAFGEPIAIISVEHLNDLRASADALSRAENWPDHAHGWRSLRAAQDAIDAALRLPTSPEPEEPR